MIEYYIIFSILSFLAYKEIHKPKQLNAYSYIFLILIIILNVNKCLFAVTIFMKKKDKEYYKCYFFFKNETIKNKAKKS